VHREPDDRTSAAKAATDEPRAQGSLVTPPHVLLVEDNEVTRKLVRAALEHAGIRVVLAPRAADALRLARTESVDLVLQDLVLPDADGFELLGLLRPLLRPGVPVLAFTGLLSAHAEGRLCGAGFDDVITKPVEPARLREIVRTYLPSEAQPAGAVGSGKRVLLVDDDAVQRKLVAFRLGRAGFIVTQAADGEEALRIAQSSTPDSIVSDVLMPGIDGFELTRRARHVPSLRNCPIVLLTNSYLEESDRQLARTMGADAYVTRSPDLTELLSTLLAIAPASHSLEVPAIGDATVERSHIERALSQLDRQVVLNTTLTHRCAMMSAEIAILGGLTNALAEKRDIDAALDTALDACFDAGGISWGFLFVRESGIDRKRAIGLSAPTRTRVEQRVEAVLALATARNASGEGPGPLAASEVASAGLALEEALLAPIVHRATVLGFLLLGMGRVDDHRAAFAEVVAGQIASTLVLAGKFQELERASKADRAHARLLASVLDAIPDPVLVVECDHRVSHANGAARREGLADVSSVPERWPSELGLQHPHRAEAVPWDELPVVRALAGENVEQAELRRVRREGEAQWLAVRARAVRSEDGAIERAVAVVRDVTTERLQTARQIGADRMASIGLLAAGVAHEINNPLTAVLAELELAMEQLGAERSSITEGLRAAHAAAERVRTLVRDLKTLSRAEQDEVAVIDVRRTLDLSIRMAAPETRTRAVVTRRYDDPLPSVRANESRLGQVFLNLLVNAAHAIASTTGTGHRIDVRARESAGGVCVEVEDTGGGMTDAVRNRVFAPFFTTKASGTGTGLGLAISRQIVSAYGGRIEFETQVGRGTTFRVWLPAAAADPTPAPPRRSAGSPSLAPPRRARVLIVDDDALVLLTLSRILRSEHDVETESSSPQALNRLVAGANYEVILCDVNMPEISGLELIQRLEPERPDLAGSVVLMTGGTVSDDMNEPARRRGLGARVCIEKPIDPKSLRQLVRERIESVTQAPARSSR
jgi:CheY-like chemotaxis protein